MTTEPVASPVAWRTYEAIGRHLLNELRAHLGLRVEHYHSVTGQSGTTWEIDAKGIRKGDEGFVIIECRSYRNDRVTQEEVAGLAYRIWDSGAAGGLVVSPHDLQAGAKLVAAHEGIAEIKMAPVSTTTDYMVKFLDQIFVARSTNLIRLKFTVTGTLHDATPAGEVSRHPPKE
jgi:Restriction endonuclease